MVLGMTFNNITKLLVLFLFVGFLLGFGFAANPKSCDVYDGEDTFLPVEGCTFNFDLTRWNSVNGHWMRSMFFDLSFVNAVDYDFKLSKNVSVNIEIDSENLEIDSKKNFVDYKADIKFEIDLKENGQKYNEIDKVFLDLDKNDSEKVTFNNKEYLTFKVTMPQTSEGLATVVVKPTQQIIEEATTNVKLCGLFVTLNKLESCFFTDTDMVPQEITLKYTVGAYEEILIKLDKSYLDNKYLGEVKSKTIGNEFIICTLNYNVAKTIRNDPNIILTAINPVYNKNCSFGAESIKTLTTTSCKSDNGLKCTDWKSFNDNVPDYTAKLTNGLLSISDMLPDSSATDIELPLQNIVFCNIARENMPPLERYFKNDVGGLKVCKTQEQIEQASKEQEEKLLGCETVKSISTTKFKCENNTDSFRTWESNTLTVDTDNDPESTNVVYDLLANQKLKCNIDYGQGVETEHYQIKSGKLQICTEKSGSEKAAAKKTTKKKVDGSSGVQKQAEDLCKKYGCD